MCFKELGDLQERRLTLYMFGQKSILPKILLIQWCTGQRRFYERALIQRLSTAGGKLLGIRRRRRRRWADKSMEVKKACRYGREGSKLNIEL
jgi:hypothetical protein